MPRMSAKPSAQHGLYDPSEETPSLNGSRCSTCDTSFFPPLSIGCERCGNPNLIPATLAARGKIHAAATVHLHAGKDIEAPFTVAEILLDDGPLIRGLLTEVTEEDVIDARVAGEWVITGQDDEGNDTLEPRFRVLPEGAHA